MLASWLVLAASLAPWLTASPAGLLARWLVLAASPALARRLDVLAGWLARRLASSLSRCIAVFAGWVVKREITRDELDTLNASGYALWHFLIRFVVPPALVVIFVMGVSE